MQRVKFIQRYKENNIGDVVSVTNNKAHFLIEKGYAVLNKEKIVEQPADKMMRARKRYRSRKTRGSAYDIKHSTKRLQDEPSRNHK